MSTTYDDQQEFAQARAAIAAFNRVAPQLTMYARTLTKKNVRVQPGSQTRTDGNTIYIRPPLSMATPLKHERSACEKFDAEGISLCPACASRENLMYQLQHEIAHIMFGSFEPIVAGNMYDYWTAAMSTLPQKVYEKMRLESNNPKNSGSPLIGIVNLSGDTHLPTLQLFTEDLRIDERSYIERPGLRKQAYAQYSDILNNGIPSENGGPNSFWYTFPIDMQICAAVLFKSKGLRIDNMLHDEAVAVVSDSKIEAMLEKTTTAVDQYGTGIVTVRLLNRIRALGYMKYIEPEEEEGEGEDESGEEGDTGDEQSGDGQSDGSDQGGSSGGDTDAEGEGGSGDSPSEPDDDGGESESKGSSSGDDEASDDGDSDDHDKGERSQPRRAARQSELDRLVKYLTGHDREIEQTETPEELEGTDSYETGTPEQNEERLSKVLDAAWLLDHIPRNIAGIKEFGKGEGEAFEKWGYRDGHTIDRVPESIIGKSVMQARIAFGNNARVTHQRNQRSGKINGNVLGKRAALGDDRLFGRKITPDKRNYHVLMGLDISYSTANGNIYHIQRAASALADVCARVGVDFSIYAHSTVEPDDWYNQGEKALSVGMWKVKETKDVWDAKAKQLLAELRPVSGNLDGHSLQYYRKKLDEAKATDKILMYFTDGAMPASNYDEELMVLQSEIVECKRRNYTLLGVGVGTDSPTRHGLETVRVNGPQDYPEVVRMLSRKIIRSN
jgi:cobalamin biosynthesis protein CobT